MRPVVLAISLFDGNEGVWQALQPTGDLERARGLVSEVRQESIEVVRKAFKFVEHLGDIMGITRERIARIIKEARAIVVLVVGGVPCWQTSAAAGIVCVDGVAQTVVRASQIS